jgi:hypothetical protein
VYIQAARNTALPTVSRQKLASFPCLDDSTNHENGRRTVAVRYGFCEPSCGTEIVLRLERLLRQ